MSGKRISRREFLQMMGLVAASGVMAGCSTPETTSKAQPAPNTNTPTALPTDTPVPTNTSTPSSTPTLVPTARVTATPIEAMVQLDYTLVGIRERLGDSLMRVSVTDKRERVDDGEGRRWFGQLPEYTSLFQNDSEVHMINPEDMTFRTQEQGGEVVGMTVEFMVGDRLVEYHWNDEFKNWMYQIKTESGLLAMNFSSRYFEFGYFDEENRVGDFRMDPRHLGEGSAPNFLINDVYFADENRIVTLSAGGENSREANVAVSEGSYIDILDNNFNPPLFIESPFGSEDIVNNTALAAFAMISYAQNESTDSSRDNYIKDFITRYHSGTLKEDERKVSMGDSGQWTLGQGGAIEINNLVYSEEEAAEDGGRSMLDLERMGFNVEDGKLTSVSYNWDFGASSLHSFIIQDLQDMLRDRGIVDKYMEEVIYKISFGIERDDEGNIVRVMYPIGLDSGLTHKQAYKMEELK